MRARQDCGGTDHDCSCINQGHGKFSYVSYGQVELFDPDTSLDKGRNKIIYHLLCTFVHRYIRNNHRVSGRAEDPITIGINNKCRIFKYLAMTGGYHFYVVRRKFLKVLFNHVPERHHDLGKVSLSGFIDAPFISGIEIGGCNMGAEKITTEKDLVFFQISHHGLRPVDPRGINKL